MVNEMIMPKASEIGKVRATPAARKLARERDIDLEKSVVVAKMDEFTRKMSNNLARFV